MAHMKNNEDPRWLEHKRKKDNERREAAIHRRKQEALRALTPGVATPGSIKQFRDLQWIRNH